MAKGTQIRQGVQKAVGTKNLQTLSNGLEKVDSTLTMFTVGSIIGGSIFLLSPTQSEAKSICGEEL